MILVGFSLLVTLNSTFCRHLWDFETLLCAFRLQEHCHFRLQLRSVLVLLRELSHLMFLLHAGCFLCFHDADCLDQEGLAITFLTELQSVFSSSFAPHDSLTVHSRVSPATSCVGPPSHAYFCLLPPMHSPPTTDNDSSETPFFWYASCFMFSCVQVATKTRNENHPSHLLRTAHLCGSARRYRPETGVRCS